MMLDMIGNDIQKYLDLVATRQKLVISNIANVDTPGYQTQDIDFEAEFARLSLGQNPEVISVPDLPVKNDGNDVNIDRESRLLSENALRFRLAITLLKDQFSTIKQVLQSDKS
jgi:flagellar basal-body rod protein FlgB